MCLAGRDNARGTKGFKNAVHLLLQDAHGFGIVRQHAEVFDGEAGSTAASSAGSGIEQIVDEFRARLSIVNSNAEVNVGLFLGCDAVSGIVVDGLADVDCRSGLFVLHEPRRR